MAPGWRLFDDRGEQADYAVSLRDIPNIDSSRLLIEAEPLNKPLENRGHGLDQVKSWLSQRDLSLTTGLRRTASGGSSSGTTPTHTPTTSFRLTLDLRTVFRALYENDATTGAASPTDAVGESIERVATLIGPSRTTKSARSSTTRTSGHQG